ncbi:hypothetical protein QYF36_019502 [Acer negundo]|nr:hypothetical protein QYF36_019502 [Acer negundo]
MNFGIFGSWISVESAGLVRVLDPNCSWTFMAASRWRKWQRDQLPWIDSRSGSSMAGEWLEVEDEVFKWGAFRRPVGCIWALGVVSSPY